MKKCHYDRFNEELKVQPLGRKRLGGTSRDKESQGRRKRGGQLDVVEAGWIVQSKGDQDK